MNSKSSVEKIEQVLAAKKVFRDSQATKTWEERVKAIAKMNSADTFAKKSMMISVLRKK